MFNMLFLNMVKNTMPAQESLSLGGKTHEFMDVFVALAENLDTQGVHQKELIVDVQKTPIDEIDTEVEQEESSLVALPEDVEIDKMSSSCEVVFPKELAAAESYPNEVPPIEELRHLTKALPNMTSKMIDTNVETPPFKGVIPVGLESDVQAVGKQDPNVSVALQNAQKPTHLVPQFVPQQEVMLDEDFQQKQIKNPYLESKITLTETNIPIASLSKKDVPLSSFRSIGLFDKIEKRSAQMHLPMTESLVSEKALPNAPQFTKDFSTQPMKPDVFTMGDATELGGLGDHTSRMAAPEKSVQIPHALQSGPVLPKQAAQQIAEMIVVSKPQEVELSLSPQELGKLRVSIAQTDQGLVVSLSAEREPTLALMRRHAEDLSNALVELGHDAPQFSFSQFSDSQTDENSMEFYDDFRNLDHQITNEESSDVTQHTRQLVLTQSGLDLRL